MSREWTVSSGGWWHAQFLDHPEGRRLVMGLWYPRRRRRTILERARKRAVRWMSYYGAIICGSTP